MRHSLTALPDATLPFDDIIDVRAPSEFAVDHIPGAINLPVLSDAERARVGTIYVRESRFLARKIGAALVARNAANHIEGALADRDGGWRPLAYCWRGGQRSGSFATILAQIGWRVRVVEGGYRSYRHLVHAQLYEAALPHRLIVVDGGTGTGKTQLLQAIAKAGGQVVDLEDLARHRGSNFGGLAEEQPAQKMFESRLARVLHDLSPDRPVFLEAESNAIGRLKVPPSVWRAMSEAPVIQVKAPAAARARFLLTTYPDLTADAALLADRIDRLRPYHPRDRIEEWHDLARTGTLTTLAEALIRDHYDPRYARPSGADRRVLGTLQLGDLGPEDLARAADQALSLATDSTALQASGPSEASR
ncbi:tRNA 2-selenouridine synthase [Jannaschia pagri]|uniref:tRNA 2-selenouridine synthase n=1 Tax=Jannaschia pagri TaxID=2829797 RepID=A0ABQ4NR35_9RHOB|nr:MULTISPECIES: tRNA 2-selenouridine(34) synthase MnmH [unclassified Jannaschia]GIT93042.1 tRNA 2-selenouridine synthase [Jannaschia sp. AI_61]GIT96877.1 tRNA 2-selenouridine synthase [Jannaschia sp. AI_62]